jgi:hypothetical protein
LFICCLKYNPIVDTNGIRRVSNVFTGEDENIAKIERFAKPMFKRFKFDIHKYGFYLDVETKHGTYPKYITYPSYAVPQ